MLLNRSKTMVVLSILCTPLVIVSAAAEDLTAYANTCKQKVGVAVQGFDCLKGTEIPMDGTAGGNCTKPPYLTSASCRKGSRWGAQATGDENIAIIWLCRKKDATNPNNNIFDDIAVIQTNYVNGATCFYQRLEDADGSKVPAPDAKDADKFWLPPAEAADQECASCHDTGLLRTPYLTQAGFAPTKRHTNKYWFPGTDFLSWNGKVYKINDTAPKKTCTLCHAMGANTIDPTSGTSTWLGLMATGKNPTPHLTPPDHAFWMKPGRTAPNPEDIANAERMSNCALGNPVPNCNLVLWGGELEAVIEAQKGRKLPALKQPPREESKPYDKQ